MCRSIFRNNRSHRSTWNHCCQHPCIFHVHMVFLYNLNSQKCKLASCFSLPGSTYNILTLTFLSWLFFRSLWQCDITIPTYSLKKHRMGYTWKNFWRMPLYNYILFFRLSMFLLPLFQLTYYNVSNSWVLFLKSYTTWR